MLCFLFNRLEASPEPIEHIPRHDIVGTWGHLGQDTWLKSQGLITKGGHWWIAKSAGHLSSSWSLPILDRSFSHLCSGQVWGMWPGPCKGRGDPHCSVTPRPSWSASSGSTPHSSSTARTSIRVIMDHRAYRGSELAQGRRKWWWHPNPKGQLGCRGGRTEKREKRRERKKEYWKKKWEEWKK